MSDQQFGETDLTSAESPHFTTDQPLQQFAAWEEVEAGRFMPRRVRGSFRGRALG
ncbi:MAG: hypothetical protein KDA96_24170 [Planctomycetaceae bacterium]|nr:hypothetical protein [Planctomycetaceae bacterium]